MVDLNRASLAQLLSLDCIDETKAYDLMLWRPFMSWDEVENAPTLCCEDVEQLKSAGATVDLPSSSAWATFAADLVSER